MSGIAGFLSRADLGLRAPQSVSYNIDKNAGMTLHYGGAGSAPSDHDGCIRTWKSWQAYHMDTKGWVDIAYSLGFCDHGYILAGRGFGIRTAANGTNPGNQQSHAACWIGGAASTPSLQALDAADWLIAENRRLGGRLDVWAHSDWKSTGCPGDPLRAHVRSRSGVAIGAPAPIPVTPPAPAPASTPVAPPSGRPQREPHALGVAKRGMNTPYVHLVQRAAGMSSVGLFGPKTEAAVKDLQRRIGVAADGMFGPISLRAFLASHGLIRRGDKGNAVKFVQMIGAVGVDGDFGPVTEDAVKEMQRWAHITDDGIVGPDTRSKIVR